MGKPSLLQCFILFCIVLIILYAAYGIINKLNENKENSSPKFNELKPFQKEINSWNWLKENWFWVVLLGLLGLLFILSCYFVLWWYPWD